MPKETFFKMVVATALILGLAYQVAAKQFGPKFVVRSGGKVEVGSVKIDPVPPPVRVIERIAKGEKPIDALKNEGESRMNDTKTLANLPQIPSQIENSLMDQFRQIIGPDIVDVIEVLNLPNQIMRTLPAATVQLLEGPRNIKEVAKTTLGVPVLTALIQAKDYYKDKAKPIPQSVKLLLATSFTPEILNNARYVVDDFGGNVPAIINKLQETLGEEHAVTIDNIIVFSAPPKDNNIYFWAHELQHTVQYAKKGMAKFAGEYTTNYKALEKEANDVAANALTKAEEIVKLLEIMAALKS